MPSRAVVPWAVRLRDGKLRLPDFRRTEPQSKDHIMKTRLLACAVALAFAGMSGAANAKGCLKGAAVGGIGGHVAGHHGLIGAAAGCAVGVHMAHKKDAKMNQAAQPSTPSTPATTATTATPATTAGTAPATTRP
jgi:hypothetical protein